MNRPELFNRLEAGYRPPIPFFDLFNDIPNECATQKE